MFKCCHTTTVQYLISTTSNLYLQQDKLKKWKYEWHSSPSKYFGYISLSYAVFLIIQMIIIPVMYLPATLYLFYYNVYLHQHCTFMILWNSHKKVKAASIKPWMVNDFVIVSRRNDRLVITFNGCRWWWILIKDNCWHFHWWCTWRRWLFELTKVRPV